VKEKSGGDNAALLYPNDQEWGLEEVVEGELPSTVR